MGSVEETRRGLVLPGTSRDGLRALEKELPSLWKL